MYKNIVLVVSSLAILIFHPANIFAEDTITTVKKKKVVIALDGNTPFKKGDVFTASKDGKEARLVISTVKKNKAVGIIKAGTASVGMTLKKSTDKSVGAKADKVSRKSKDKSEPKKSGGMSYGVLAGIGLDSISVKLIGATAKASGMGFVGKGVLVLPMGSSLFIRAGLGIETFKAEATISTPACNGSSKCVVEINFLTADGFLGWNIVNGDFKMYIGGGAGLLFPSSNNTNALSQSSIKQTASFDLGGGISFGLGKTMRVPVEVIYSALPPSQEVTTSMIRVLTGFTF
ncbi:MAG: hypothetical protein SGJ18_09120 [Pseudomonadota bacterium]|nr:hypothetical protein [Pseudomonadota bacterium]